MPVTTNSNGVVIYTTVDGDTVSNIAAVHIGTQRGAAEAIFDANPGLAALGLVLSAGVQIKLPPKPKAIAKKPVINLFD